MQIVQLRDAQPADSIHSTSSSSPQTDPTDAAKDALMSAKPSKFCGTCGRAFTWRASLRNWDEAKYCSQSCRTKKPNNLVDKGIEASFLKLLLVQKSSPSSAAILCENVQKQDGEERTSVDWRERYRRAARRLANVEELCEIEHNEKGSWLQGDGKGEMRLRLRGDKIDAAELRLSHLTAKATDQGSEKQETICFANDGSFYR